MNALLYVVAAYLLGSIPTGLWLGKAWRGIDVRKAGSGNLGATNVYRVLGPGPGIVTLLLDMAKGFFAVFGAKHFFPGSQDLWIGTGVAAIVGHTMSVFVSFRGGKGVATSAGVFAALLPMCALIAVITFALVILTTRFVSVGSILAAMVLAASAWITRAPRDLALLASTVAIYVVWTHRANVRRLAAGTEPKIGRAPHMST